MYILETELGRANIALDPGSVGRYRGVANRPEI
jgi:hypothetical protein